MKNFEKYDFLQSDIFNNPSYFMLIPMQKNVFNLN